MNLVEAMHFVFDKLVTVQTAVDQQFRGELALQNRFKRVVPKFLNGPDKDAMLRATLVSARNVLNGSTWTLKNVRVVSNDSNVDGDVTVIYDIETDNSNFDADLARSLSTGSPDPVHSASGDAFIDVPDVDEFTGTDDGFDPALHNPIGGFTASCNYVVKKEFAFYG